ncbi:Ig-like domain-containing protein [Aneurinibacillus aneurinilyticus]|uniref:RCC1 domain-containing protein n=1 Tax=Aneurinibacillus aneurinilyticus TaxID=1391 RepID=UPI002E22DD91|nr:Ig-like domain-containing protein [Aneurinibacillus aneurinilyticus]
MNKKNACMQALAAIGLVSGTFVSDIPVVSAQQVQAETFSVASIQTESGIDIKTKLPFDTKLVIRFTNPIEQYTVDDSSLFIADESGNRVSVTKTFTDQDKTVIVKPPSSGYNPGHTYTLHVKNDIYSKDGKKLNKAVVQELKIQNKIVSIQGDQAHTFFIGSNGEVWRSGQESFLLMEKEQNKSIFAPQVYEELENVKTIVKGKAHYLALKEDGTVWAWGDNKSGELGDGTKESKNTPVQVKELTDVMTIIASNDAAGNGYSIALKKDGTIWAWGSNQYGQLGVGDWNGVTITKPMRVQDLNNIVSVASGTGNVFAIEGDGKVYAWGDNRLGQLGDDSTQTRYRPVRIKDLKGIERIVTGKNYALAYEKNGNAYAWGNNESGQLGNGSSSSNDVPKQVNGLFGIQEMVTVENSNYVLKNDGTVWIWGQNEKGQLGDGTTNSRFSPVKLDGLSDIQSIAVDGKNGVALDKEGNVWFWGQTQRTDVEKENVLATPVQIKTLSNIKQIYAKAGSYFAIGADGTIWAWGENAVGQLGNGTNKSQAVPVKIPVF